MRMHKHGAFLIIFFFARVPKNGLDSLRLLADGGFETDFWCG